jgi:hypothetical protein
MDRMNQVNGPQGQSQQMANRNRSNTNTADPTFGSQNFGQRQQNGASNQVAQQ